MRPSGPPTGRKRTATNDAFDRLLVARFGRHPSNREIFAMGATSMRSLAKMGRGEPVRADVAKWFAAVLRIAESDLPRAIATK